jgi:methionyl-tRNA formyltransferase
LMNLGARLVIKTLALIDKKGLKPIPQSQLLEKGESPKIAPKIFLKECIINWQKDSISVHNLIRGLSPNPCARSFLVKDSTSIIFKIFESNPEPEAHSLKPGEIVTDGKHFLKIACKDGFLNVVSLQIEGKKRMTTLEFLRGFNISDYKTGLNQPA